MNKKGTWTTEECRREYVESEKDHSYESLSKASGYAQSTLKRWSRLDPKGRWKDQRSYYRTALSRKTEEKTLEKLSDKLSDKYSKIQERHYNSYRVYSELATYYARVKIKALKEAEQKGSEEVVAELKKINPTAVNCWNLVLDRSLKGEAQSLGLSFYVHEQSAIQGTERMGYQVVELPAGMTKENLQELIDEFEADS